MDAIGSLLLEICGETDPCERMDAQHDGLRLALESAWRGGVSCRVLAAGVVSVGDAAELLPAEAAAASPLPR